jgi:hypothetical protein
MLAVMVVGDDIVNGEEVDRRRAKMNPFFE